MEGKDMSKVNKLKKPEHVVNAATADYYMQYGTTLVEEGKLPEEPGYRFDHVVARKFKLPNSEEVKTNDITLSQPSSEVLTLMKKGEEWFLVLGKQARSPYLVKVDGKIYFRTFIEQAAGLLEEGQSFLDAAIAETRQELGARLVYLGELIVPRLFRHVSYTDEVSKLYLAVTEWLGDQDLDPEENINVDVIPLDKAKEEFDAYLDGDKDSFFNFDIPDVTMLSMTVFFRKLENGKIDLNHLTGNLL